MRNQRYKLRYPGSSKRNVPCPNGCKAGDNPSYTVFLDSETNELCSDEFGYCNKCEYIKFPSDGKFNYQKSQWTKYRNSKNGHQKKVNRTLIPNDTYKNWTIKKDDILPNFFERLKILDDTEKYQLCRMYGIGVVPYCPRHLILPYISIKGEIMTAQIKFFDKQNKTIENGWIHQHRFAKQCGLPNDWRSRVENRESSLTSCMMGEHLLKKYSSRNVVIHESLKNALYYTAKVGIPKKSNSNPVQLATGSKSYLSLEKIKNITTKVKRNLVFIPDPENDAVEQWTEVANRVEKELSAFWNVEVVDLRKIIPDLKTGDDIADYLDEKWNAPDFVKPAPKIDTVLKFKISQSISNNSTPELRNAKGVDLSKPNQLNDTEATTEPVEEFVEIEKIGNIEFNIKGQSRNVWNSRNHDNTDDRQIFKPGSVVTRWMGLNEFKRNVEIYPICLSEMREKLGLSKPKYVVDWNKWYLGIHPIQLKRKREKMMQDATNNQEVIKSTPELRNVNGVEISKPVSKLAKQLELTT